MIVSFLGVRGSTLALGPEFAGYGGHTSCIAVGHVLEELNTRPVVGYLARVRNLPEEEKA